MSDDPGLTSPKQPSGEMLGRERTRRRFQFSLRGLLLFTLFAAMTIALVVTGQRLHRAEVELSEYRSEYGILRVDDPSRLCAVACWTPEPKCWRWRVHFPPGQYRVCYATTEILPHGIPTSDGGVGGEFSGTIDVSAAVFRDERDGVWRCSLSAGGGKLFVDIPPSLVNPRGSTSDGVLWGKGPAVAETDDCFLLLRHRIAKADKNGAMSLVNTDPSDGLLIWIVREGVSPGQGPSQQR